MSPSHIFFKSFQISDRSRDILRCDLRSLKDGRRKACVIICHSFMAFKDWGFFPYVAEKIAEAGFTSIIFNFSHNGIEADNTKITNFNKFERNTLSRELEEVSVIVNAIFDGPLSEESIDHRKIVLLGHSRGGGLAIVHTASDARIRALVTWSSVATFDRWTNHQKELWRKIGYLPLAKDSNVSPLRLGLNLLQDLESHQERLNINQAAKSINVPWLIIHGKADIPVPCKEGEVLYSLSQKSTTRFVLLDHVGHLYTASSPIEDNFETLNHILTLTTDWLRQKLSKE